VLFDDLAILISASGAALAGAAALYWAVRARWFVAVPPNRALVLFGRPSQHLNTERGLTPDEVNVQRPRIIVGARVFVPPWNKGVGRIALDPVSVDASVRSLYPVDGSRTSGWDVQVRVLAKVPAEPGSLMRAAENLLGKTDEEVRAVVAHTVEAAVPAVLRRLQAEQAEPDWDRLAAEIEATVAPELLGWGFVIRTLTVTELRRILPADASPVRVPARLPPVSSVPGEPGTLPTSYGGLDARLGRAERNLGIVSYALARLYQETRGSEDPTDPVSVFDLPLGYEFPSSVAFTEGVPAVLHESSEGDRSPPSLPRSAERGVGEGRRSGPAPLD
jgi:hypothetical protein